MLKQKRFLDSQSKSTKDTKSSPLATTLRYLLVTLMSLVLVSKITTSSLFFNYPIPFSLPTLNELQARFLPTALPASPAVPTLLLTPAQLALYDGRHPPKGIYLAIDGEVYDVTTGDAYQPGGSYGLFAGKDAARAFITGCFKPKGLTHDLRGLTEEELEVRLSFSVFPSFRGWVRG